jgi:predicted DNA-binding protein (MmcQ/YjbR family)
MREICLSLPGAAEAPHFGESCFRVGKRIFASCGGKAGVCRLVFQLEPGHASKLVGSDPRFARYARQKNCVSIDAADVKSWDEVRALVLESYRLNSPGDRMPREGRAATRKKVVQKRRPNRARAKTE